MSDDLNQAEAAEPANSTKPNPYAKLDSATLRRLGEQLAEQMYPAVNLAVELCCEMYLHMKEEKIKEGKSVEEAFEAGKLAYCSSVPKLCGADNVRDFIACVAHGMLMGVFSHSDGTKLLYAAQVAFGALPSPKRREKCRKKSQKHPAKPSPNQTS